MAVDLESDILGTWRMTATTQAGTRIIASFDEAPEYEAFKALALNAADAEAGSGSQAAGKRKRRPKPEAP